MRRLDRYILGEFLAPLGLIVSGMAVLVLLVQMVDQLPRLRQFNPTTAEVFLYYAYQFPYIATQVVPVAVMLAVLVAMGGLARTSELTAMGAGGVSRLRVALPLLAAGLGVSLALLGLSETLVPLATARSRYIEKVSIEKRNLDWDQPWRSDMAKRLPGGRQLYTQTFDAQDGTMRPVIVVAAAPDGTELERIDADEARWVGGGRWRLTGGVDRLFRPDGSEAKVTRFAQEVLALDAAPADFAVDTQRRPEDLLEMSVAELTDLADRIRDTGGDDREERVCVQVRLSYPFSCLILAMLAAGLPYLFPSGKRALTGAAIGLVVSLASGMLYLVFVQVGISLGTSSTLPPAPSAWLGNLVFGAAGSAVLWRANR